MYNCALVGKVEYLKNLRKDDFVERVKEGFIALTGEKASSLQENAWKDSWGNAIEPLFNNIHGDIWAIFEYRLPGSLEMIDLLLLGKNEGKPVCIVIEFKGWSKANELSDKLVEVGSERYQHPDIQTTNYVNKLKLSHSVAQNYEICGIAWLYNLGSSESTLNFTWSKPFYKEQIQEVIKHVNGILEKGVDEDEVDSFLKGQYVQTPHLFDIITNYKTELLKGAIEVLARGGVAPSEEQHKIISNILKTLNSNERKVFLIQGKPGSGKSYIALLVLLKALNQKKFATLALRNNRLLNTIRVIFNQIKPGLNVVQFYSTGSGSGIAEKEYIKPRYELVVFDEAQRMRKIHIKNAIMSARVSVFLYDEEQILNLYEDGTIENFEGVCEKLGVPYEKFTLNAAYRVKGGEKYHQFVETLLKNSSTLLNPNHSITLENYEFKVFDDIKEMIEELEKRKDKKQVALVASFTESPGDQKNKTAKSIENLRVGFPLYSGFNHYQGKDIKIYWLMDEKNQYPGFWYFRESNDLTHCASIYGCQGFEADYVGVIWGRDFV